MSKLHIPILIGTTREQRKSIFAAKLIHEVAQTFEDITTELVDPNDFNFPGDGNDPEGKDPNYTAITEKADGFFIVMPEYNHSFPGSLKRMLDSELANYMHKPVAFAGVSASQFAGVRGIEAVLSPVREMGMIASSVDMQFPKVAELFDDQGNIKDDHYKKYVESAWRELIWLTKTLKYGRENFKSDF